MIRSTKLVSLFALAFALPTALLTPRAAQSAVATFQGGFCNDQPAGFIPAGWYGAFTFLCPLTVGAGGIALSGLNGIYFDVGTPTATAVSLSLTKVTTSNTFAVDTATRASQPTYNDFYLAANNVKQNASVWDYLYARVSPAASVLGVALVGQ